MSMQHTVIIGIPVSASEDGNSLVCSQWTLPLATAAPLRSASFTLADLIGRLGKSTEAMILSRILQEECYLDDTEPKLYRQANGLVGCLDHLQRRL